MDLKSGLQSPHTPTTAPNFEQDFHIHPALGFSWKMAGTMHVAIVPKVMVFPTFEVCFFRPIACI